MSTQHPDNVSVPFFAPNSIMSGEDEVREAYYAYSHLGCDEQMWDAEGKEVDGFVVEKLLATYPEFFREHPLGERVFLTPRVPNPAVERSQAKILLEVLHSLPRHSDVARLFHERECPPIIEVILPMTTAARELERIQCYYERFVAGIADAMLLPEDGPLGASFGTFSPDRIAVIPLLEDHPRLAAADSLVSDFLRGKALPYQRVFIARSDPALNYGMVGAVVLTLIAMERLRALERETGIGIYPILGAGSAPFRGNLRPSTVRRVLAMYPSVQTFTIQSAFKYDHPAAEVAAAIGLLKEAPLSEPLPVADDPRALAIVDRVSAAYRDSVVALAPLVRAVAQHVPRRRMRKLHVGLFGYSRSAGNESLPRAIPFCAALYSLGVPPEILGLAALNADDRRWLAQRAPGFYDDLRDAVRYLDVEATGDMPNAVRADVAAAVDFIGETDREHVALSHAVRRRALDGPPDGLGDLIVRAAALRRFLG